MMTNSKQYQLVAAALPLLAGAARLHWKEAAAEAGLSPYYFQRLFRRHIGVSPRQYAACLTLSDVKQRLAAGDSVLAAALAAGLSGGGRAHDLFISMEGVTPGQFAGGDVHIDYGCADSPFGKVFIAATARGICFLQFIGAAPPSALLARLQRQWQHARLCASAETAQQWARRAFAGAATPLHVRGTNFQIKVWQALLAVAAGTVASYSGLAQVVTGSPAAARAVAAAAAANPVTVLIPCHRLLAVDGKLTGYVGGVERKRSLLASEFARHGIAVPPCV